MQAEEGLFYVPQSRNTLLDKITQAYFKRVPRDPKGPRFLDNSTDNMQSIGGSHKHLGQTQYGQDSSISNRHHGLRSMVRLTPRQWIASWPAALQERFENTSEAKSGCQSESGQICGTRAAGVLLSAEDQPSQRIEAGLAEGTAWNVSVAIRAVAEAQTEHRDLEADVRRTRAL